MRVQLARILLSQAELLLLDEPTNYLDIESILWLEQWLRDYRGAVLMTCHDKDVMNRVVDKIVEIDGGRMRTYTATTTPTRPRARSTPRSARPSTRSSRRCSRRICASSRDSRRSRRARRRAEPLRRSSRRSSDSSPAADRREGLQLPETVRGSNDVVALQHVSKAYGSHVVHRRVDLVVRRAERWAIMGENGRGKTTLLR
jgi:ATP-binding cassette subfamily F protein 3